MRECRILLKGPWLALEVLVCPRKQTTLQNVCNIPLGVQFDSRWDKKKGGFPGCSDSCPNHDRLGILMSGDNPSFCGGIEDPNSIILLVYHLLNVEFLLVCENQVRQRAFINILQNFLAFLGPHCRCSILKGFCPRSSLNIWCIVDLLTPAASANVLQLRRGFRRSFSLAFLIS